MGATRTPGITIGADGRFFIDKRHRGIRIGVRVGATNQEQAEQRLRTEMQQVDIDLARRAYARPTFAWSVIQAQRGGHPVWVFPYRGRHVSTTLVQPSLPLPPSPSADADRFGPTKIFRAAIRLTPARFARAARLRPMPIGDGPLIGTTLGPLLGVRSTRPQTAPVGSGS